MDYHARHSTLPLGFVLVVALGMIVDRMIGRYFTLEGLAHGSFIITSSLLPLAAFSSELAIGRARRMRADVDACEKNHLILNISGWSRRTEVKMFHVEQ
jgi:predicted anti-sigma-YlaC factor YlaD